MADSHLVQLRRVSPFPRDITPDDVTRNDLPFKDAIGLVSEGFCPCLVIHKDGHQLDGAGFCEGCGCTWKVISSWGKHNG